MLNFGASGFANANNFNNIGLPKPQKRARHTGPNVPPPVAEREYTNTNMKPYIPGEVDAAATMFECMKYGDSYLYLKKPDEPIAAEDFPQEQYESMAELLDHPGIYTWILLEDDRFIAGRTFTPGEIYSKHSNLYRPRMQRGDGRRVGILAAGECRIEPQRKVVYNFLSGTYMRHIGLKYTQRTNKNYTNFYKKSFDDMWKAAGAADVSFIGSPLLPTSVSDADIAPYLNIGYEKHIFDTKDKCSDFEDEEKDREMDRQIRDFRHSASSGPSSGGGKRKSRRYKKQSRRRQTVNKSRRRRH
jgi:hypothetical protein